MYNFERLKVWQFSLDFLEDIYKLIEQLPRIEKSNLTDQLRRASTSISLNIAEGSATDSRADFVRYLYISRKSAYEVVAILKIIERIHNVRTVKYTKKIDEIGKMLNGLIKSIKSES